MKFLLLHLPSWSPDSISQPLAQEGVEVRQVSSASEVAADHRPTVLLLDAPARSHFTPHALVALRDAGVAVLALGANGEEDVPHDLPTEALAGFVRGPIGGRQLLVGLRSALLVAAAQQDTARARAETAARTSEITELTNIGIQLTTEKDYNKLLDLILNQARRITQSDAGSLYVVETDDRGEKRLRFKLSQNDSRPDIPFVEFTMPIDQASLAGYAASEGEPLVIDDVYTLPPDVEYAFNRSFDQRYGYRTKSMLVIPMVNHHGEVIGVLQLINRKRDFASRLASPEEADREVISYSPHTVKIVRALAGQAAVSIENSQLYEAIERLFEGFVKAAVTAIEQRDPTTSGHSERVATRTVALATLVDRVDDGPYRLVNFTPEQIREIRYAGLLHDFGKVGVREQVLVKAKKLYGENLTLIRQRHAFIRRSAQWRFEKERSDYLLANGRQGYEAFLLDLESRHEAEIALTERFLRVVLESNEPTVLAEGNFEQLSEFSGRTFEDIDGNPAPFLTEPEVKMLSIRKGSLDEEERLEIESHVTHTFDFLRRIPWTKGLSQIPDIAHAHHEKLNGRGYPRRIEGDAIPLQTRMMTIADIYDALTAKDRPYKRAVPAERALGIMQEEVKGGMLDAQLFRLFVDHKVWEKAG
ncbi:MAG TPA: HD domain-containing phosphohydrolase [Gemmatimonadales bacterium]|jgi:HD-GYP domain-containing protein (c-di-GMP phosphodiesterase class II)